MDAYLTPEKPDSAGEIVGPRPWAVRRGGAALGRFTSSAIGTTVTSCAFAEEVCNAYADGGDSTIVMAHSPVDNRDYQMNCAAGDQFATGNGGANAIVYVY
ncbi:hypothetical protein [Nocardia sp. NPDC049707]|uniref:hypothetical protein n=1 Tax=Nocardia sp. NPDC049707 TaxID=3154735 RepID=UPI00342F4C0B